MTILVENARYRLTLARPDRPSGITVLSWPYFRDNYSATTDTRFPAPEPQDFATRKGMNSLRVETTRNDWFQGDGIDEVLTAINRARRDSDVLISYGSSMGGHAAIAFAPECRADYAVALAPQASLAAGFMRSIQDPRWPDSVPLFHNDRILNGRCRDLRGLMLFDPDNPRDRSHASAIAAHTALESVHVHGGWHHPGRIVNRAYGLVRLLNEIGTELSGGRRPGPFTALRTALRDSAEHRFLFGSDADRTALMLKPGIDYLERALEFPAILEALRRAPSETFIAQTARFARTPLQRRQLAATLMALGHHERGLGMIHAEGPLAYFYVPEARDFLRSIAPDLGLDAWRAEGLRLEAAGDVEGALFCLEAARTNFRTGDLIARKLHDYRKRLSG